MDNLLEIEQVHIPPVPEVIVVARTREDQYILLENKGSYGLPKGIQLDNFNLIQMAYHVLVEQTGYYPMRLRPVKIYCKGGRARVLFQSEECLKIDGTCLTNKERSYELVSRETFIRIVKDMPIINTCDNLTAS